MSVSDYSTDADLNVSISGISVAEGCAPSGINDAIRQLMADVKAESQALRVKATASAQGPVLLSDSISGTSTADKGVAASEYAVKLAYDRGSAGVTAAASAQSTADKGVSDAAKAQTAANTAQSTADAAKARADAAHSALSAAVPPGTVIAFASSKTHTGYLLCNGAAVSRTTYAALFAAISTSYGTGNGSSTFNLPNIGGNLVSEVSTGNLAVKGNGKTLGMTNGTSNGGLCEYLFSGRNYAGVYTENYNTSVSTTESYTTVVYGRIGITTDGAKSGMIVPVTATKTAMKYYIKY